MIHRKINPVLEEETIIILAEIEKETTEITEKKTGKKISKTIIHLTQLPE